MVCIRARVYACRKDAGWIGLLSAAASWNFSRVHR
jgi:hypothetical protein